ncbi:hypothetical protein J437_LFUL017850 [Ladona fulva]|uniref:Uncharacterized protein n=1 Tax=Ladona fulva TaxID=123851 RepID=A0A8K0KFF8_LADFU|nr:hypothetical protein J437_LFUL017850 [Ladona fulva]
MEIPHRIPYAKCKEKVKSLLEDLHNHELTKRVEAITKLGNLLCEDPQTRDYFYKLEGKNAILKRLFIEEKRKFVEAALFTLANSTINHVENQNSLINEYVFDLLKTIIKQSDIMELRNFSHGTIYLISTIVYQNSAGQHLVRESGCLNQLLNLFHKVLSTAWKIQNPDKELKNVDIICHALYLSVNNPKNEENQKQVAVVFPKALLYMTFLIFDNKMSNDRILPCLRLFTGTLSGNKVTQEIFIEYGGMIFLRRLLLDKVNILEEESIEMCIILMDLLIASKRLPSSELPSPSIITFLVNVLQRHKCKLVTLFLLFHLMENDVEMQEVFLKCDGHEKMKQVCLKEVENEEIDLISSGIWAMILKNNLELSKANVCSEPSKMDEDLLEDEIKINRKNITVGVKSELDASQARKVSPQVHFKASIKRKPPCVASEIDEGIRDGYDEIDEGIRDGYDDIQTSNLSAVDDMKIGLKRRLEIPCVASEIGERVRDDPDAIQTRK